MSEPSDWFASIRQQYNALGVAVRSLGEDRIEQFGTINLLLPPEDSAALHFYFSVSWMYIAVYEVGSVSFRFLADRSFQMQLDPERELSSFRRDVHALRTLLQHNLDPENTRDAQIRITAMRWMLQACDKEEIPNTEFWPSTGDEWTRVNDKWISVSARALEAARITVMAIASDLSRTTIVSEWARRCSRGLRPHEFIPIVSEAVTRHALPALAVDQIVNKHSSSWNEMLRLLDDNVDIFSEARSLVDQTLTVEWQNYCPVNGDDIIKTFSAPPGRMVGKLLTQARQIWLQERCSKEEVLRILLTQRANIVEEQIS